MTEPTLDPQVQALLDTAAAAGLPPVFTLPVAEARERMRSAFISDGPLEEVHEVAENQILAPGEPIGLRMYRPKSGVLPLLMFFHGGGWTLNDLDTHDRLCRRLANSCEAMVISVDYRRSPENPYPTQIEDCYLATVWAAAHAEKLEIDVTRIGVVGDSSGGTNATVVAMLARDRGFPSLKMQGLIYPVTDAPSDSSPSYRERATGYSLGRAFMDWFWEQYVGTENVNVDDPYLCPLRANDLSGLPPGFIVTAEFDPLRDEGRQFAERLNAAGTSVEYRNVSDQMHGFILLTATLDRAEEEMVWICDQIRELLSANAIPQAAAGNELPSQP